MSTRSRRGGIALLALLITLLFGCFAPAMAKSPHGGDTWDPATTEDTDTNDGSTANCPESAPDETQHPSGKDRYCEGGGSGNQGRSQSHPDDTNGPKRYEGAEGEADKPGDTTLEGGEYLWDQDGNNGCGNDQDFDDDNNGWCGKPVEVEGEVETTTEVETKTEVKSSQTETASAAVAPAAEASASEASVLGVVFERPAEVAPAAAAAPAQVAGVSLARTGSPIFALTALGLLLLGAGIAARRFGTRRA